jgi:hypothetical protein
VKAFMTVAEGFVGFLWQKPCRKRAEACTLRRTGIDAAGLARFDVEPAGGHEETAVDWYFKRGYARNRFWGGSDA